MVAVTLHTTDDAPVPSVLEDVVVRVYSEDGLTFITEGQTDADGMLIIELEDGFTYWVRFFKVGYRFPTKLLLDADSGASSNTFDVEAVDLTVLSPSTVPTLCRASGYVCGADLAPRSGIRFTFSLTGSPRIVSGRVMVIQDVITKSDAEGWIEIELVRNGIYDCVVDGMDDQMFRVVVPDRTSVSITELVWPYVAALAFSPSSISLGVGESVEIATTVTLSSGTETPFTLDDGKVVSAGMYVGLSITDPTIAEANLVGDVLTVTGRVAGSTTITATVNPTVEEKRLPAPTRSLGVLAITVTG